MTTYREFTSAMDYSITKGLSVTVIYLLTLKGRSILPFLVSF